MSERQERTSDPTSLFVVGASLVRRRWSIVRWVLLGGFLAGLWATLRPLTYTSFASFVPQSNDRAASNLMSLAGQFGISLNPGGSSRSPDFYRALLTSETLVDVVVRDTFQVAELDGKPVTFVDLFQIDPDLPLEERLEDGRSRLRERLATSVDNSTGMVGVSIATKWPSVSLAIINSLVDGVHAFNQRVRQDEAGAERAFVEGRLKDVRAELRIAEDSLETFLTTNRQFERSPELVLRRDRLQREVQSRQQVLTSLTQSYEEARIRELRNTPVITLVETPALPALHDPRRRILLGLVGMMLGGLIGVSLALVSSTLAHHRAAGDSDVEGLLAAIDELKRDLRNPLRWVRGVLRG
jgi:uncharacterized protein involved in exopolysaccharide biosynthesis